METFTNVGMRIRSGSDVASMWRCGLLLLVAMAVTSTRSRADSFDEAPIGYKTAPVDDPIARLQKKIDTGAVTLSYDDRHGYLPAVLEQLGSPASSQMLVFSKSSFQLDRINPESPRAVYYSDDAYIGWVQGGDVVEVSAVDPQQGAIFYSLDQRKTDRPRFVRRGDACLQCHNSALTQSVPGHLIRSLVTSPEGHLILRAGTHRTDHRSPFEERWGGWYVTGTHGRQRHMGNVVATDKKNPENLDTESGANVTDLSDRVDTTPYLCSGSDIVALMVIEHQATGHNLITFANYRTRIALENQAVIDGMLDEPTKGLSASTRQQIKYAGEKLVRYLLFTDEPALTDPVAGTSTFAKDFVSRGPRDRRGRSLRDLDLNNRLFRYPCSFLIYTEAFDGLPDPMREYVYRRLWEVLTRVDQSDSFEHFSRADRRTILEILRDTKKGLPAYWTTKSDS
jgi:hypothetical protein